MNDKESLRKLLVILSWLGVGLIAGCGTESKVAVSELPSQPEIPLAQYRAIESSLRSSDAKVRAQSLKSLAKLGKTASPFKPKLEELAEKDPDQQVRTLANELINSLPK